MLRSAWITVEPVSDAGATACDFCDHAALRRSAVLVENDLCMYVSTPRIGEPEEVLPGSDIVIPLAHEPHAGHGIRWAIKRADNRRADPLAHGQCLG